MEIKRLKIPVSENDVRTLKIGDLVTFTGLLFTGTEVFHKRAFEKNVMPPIDFKKLNVMAHAPLSIKRGADGSWEPMQWDKFTIMVTAGSRFEPYLPRLIQQLGLRAVVSKGSMGEHTKKAMAEFGCVHLTENSRLDKPGTADTVKRIVECYGYDEVGPFEATWVLEIEDWGPLVVDIDAHGNNLFDQIEQVAAERMKKAYAHFNIPLDFRYSMALPDSKDESYYSR